MALRSGLSVYAYNITNGQVTSSIEIGRFLENLEFSAIMPGGFGDLKARMKVNSLTTIPYAMRTFANVVVTAGPDVIWQGRWDEPGIVKQGQNGDGELFDLTAMGASSSLKDDALDTAYIAQTAQAIINDQVVTQRGAYIAIDQDQSQVLPNNPTATFTRGYNGQTVEQVLNDLLLGLGDYTWAVWNHPSKKDVAGFPTWQLYVNQRVNNVVSYMAYDSDITNVDVRPSIEYCYNAVTLKYKDSITGLPATPVFVKDSRLNANFSQGTAPFPFRRYTKDLSNLLLSSAQANTLANALLNQYQNGGYKIEIQLTAIRNAQGVPIDPWKVRPDGSILLPNFSLSNILLPTGVSTNNNLFYITEAHFQEQGSTSTPILTLTCNTFTDTAAFQIARLQYQQDALSANSKSAGIIQAKGLAELGKAGYRFKAANAGDVSGVAVNFKTTMTTVPSSITLTQTVAPTNVASVNYTDLQATGFQLEVTATAAGNTSWYGTYTTVGN